MKRQHYLKQIQLHFKVHRAVALLGPRQVGKSTLAREFAKSYKNDVHFFDLEDPTDLARLDSPMLALESLKGLIIIAEIQRRPDLFPVLRVLIDKKKSKFLILGSASRELLLQSSESLAGRISYLEIRPFSILEDCKIEPLWLRGGFPLSYLAKSEANSSLWLKSYISTYLERDIPLLGINLPAQTLRKFWMMLCHYHGAIFNASEIGKSLGFSGQTARRYLDILVNTFMIRELQPWHENIDKRQIKSPKIYFRDSGVFHTLLNLDKISAIKFHPKLGASWEAFALEQCCSGLEISPDNFYFWGTHAEAELDGLSFKNGRKIGFEFKFTDAPKYTKSMSIAKQDLRLNHIYVIYPGNKNFRINEHTTAISIGKIQSIDY